MEPCSNRPVVPIKILQVILFLILQNDRTCVWELSQFSKWVNSETHVWFPYIALSRISDLAPLIQCICQASYRFSTFTILHLTCLCVIIYLIFDSGWMFSPCDRLICTNKTCFAGVGTRPKTIFRIRIHFLSYPCESIKIQTFLSADQTSIQVFPVLEWNLILVLLSKILDRLKRLFVVQIPRVTVYREMRNIYV